MSPSWIVTVVCGASGTGKSWVAKRLATRYDVPLGEADDICTALQAVTTPEQQPLLHFWDTHPEALDWPPERIADLHTSVSESLRTAYEAVVADHVEFGSPVVLERDYLLPELAAGYDRAQVRAIVLDEPDEDQIVANYQRREPEQEEQRFRARVSVEVNARLVARARAAGVPVVAARPWIDGLDRVDAALRG